MLNVKVMKYQKRTKFASKNEDDFKLTDDEKKISHPEHRQQYLPILFFLNMKFQKLAINLFLMRKTCKTINRFKSYLNDERILKSPKQYDR